MSPSQKIIYDKETLIAVLKQQKTKKTVLTNGHFNVIHPGHHRFIDHARLQGDTLFIAVVTDSEMQQDPFAANFFTQEERVHNVASIQGINHVIMLGKLTMTEVIDIIQPNCYILGAEHESNIDSKLEDYINHVKKYNGHVVFHSGSIHYAGSSLLYNSTETLQEKKLEAFFEACERQKINITKIKENIKNFEKRKFLVIGDTIVDQFVACDPLGMSAEAPVIALKELETREFIGGAAIVACHIRSLGGECEFLSVTGEDKPAEFVRNTLLKRGVVPHLYIDEDRPTTFKIRYMVENQKMLRVSRLVEKSIPLEIENKVIKKLKEIIPKMDGVIISDFVYGMITVRILDNIINIANANNVMIFGDIQCSSQIGNLLKFKKFDLITPTEREARIALADNDCGLEKLSRNILKKTKCNNLLITLGSEGFIAYNYINNSVVNSQPFPALCGNPLDVAGAGDALLSALALSLTSGYSCMEASALGTCIAALAVNRIGNIPVSAAELKLFISHIHTKNYI